MISHPAYPVEPWCVRETALHLDVLAQSESVFALANGHIGWRGNLDEGEPHGLPGSYLNGVYESRRLPYAEPDYGYPEAGETVINVTNAKLIRLLIDDQPFDVRYGEVRSHERVLDFRTGFLERRAEWVSAAGRGVAMRLTRLVSSVERSVAAVCYEVEALDQALRVVPQSELVANEALPPAGGDPRVSAVLETPLCSEEHGCVDASAALVHRTEESGLGTAVLHIGADIADAVVRYVAATGDERFERGVGLHLLAETARLWRSLGHHDPEGRFRIDGVTSPDEYSAVADNNVFTNLMAKHNLVSAADIAERHPDEARRLGIDEEEMAIWRDAATAMFVPYDDALGVHPQAEGFTSHEMWDFANTSGDQYPLLLHFAYFDLYRKQVVKQADLVLATHLRSEAFTDEEKAANFAYYEY